MATDFYDGGDLEALADLHRYNAWVASMLAPRGRTLEVGAGTGNVTAAYRNRVERLTLVEPSQLVTPLRARFAHDPAVDVVQGTLDAAHADHPEWTGAFDSVVMVNVLEHVPDDVALLSRCGRALAPGGRLLVAVPALPWLHGSLDDLVGHVRRYRRRTLRAAAERAGFRVRKLHYFDALGVLPWWVTGRVLRSRAFNPWAAGVYDRVGVPLTRAAESWVRPWLGKNLVLVADRAD